MQYHQKLQYIFHSLKYLYSLKTLKLLVMFSFNQKCDDKKLSVTGAIFSWLEFYFGTWKLKILGQTKFSFFFIMNLLFIIKITTYYFLFTFFFVDSDTYFEVLKMLITILIEITLNINKIQKISLDYFKKTLKMFREERTDTVSYGINNCKIKKFKVVDELRYGFSYKVCDL